MPKIIKIKDNIVTIKGSSKYKLYQNFKLEEGVNGFVLYAEQDIARLLATGDTTKLKINSIVSEISSDSKVEVYEEYFGNVIDPFGNILFPGKKNVPKTAKPIGTSSIFNKPPSILDRVKLSEPLDTGMLSIDTMIPIGRGQRELIIGDRQTGKSTIAINTIINQPSDIKTIYINIGQKRSNVINLVEILEKNNSLKNTIIIYASPSSPAQQFMSPMIGMAMAESIAYKGQDVLVIIDDLTKHANIYREISLSLERSPGREAYPTDIFYQHSRLLERAGRFTKEKYNGGSITCLPIVETIQEDIASLIPSNIISITDGQIFTSVDLFNNGVFPSINIQKSVSRTGSSIQSNEIREISKGLKGQHAKFEEIKKFSNMAIDITKELKEKIKQGENLSKILIQYGNLGYSRKEISILVYLYKNSQLKSISDMNKFSKIFPIFMKSDPIAKYLLQKLKSSDLKEEYIKEIISPLIASINGDYSVISKEEIKKWLEVNNDR
ncbi:MAG: ATP F0F1 synthase subunit alpha [Mycoplasma sp.]|nr:ATP F0F1 synthase subunit alpha [Mycoplasma sp.]